MDFDFIRYKVRVFQTTAYNVLLFGGECVGTGTVEIQMLTRNSRPFIVVWGSTLDIDVLAQTLTALHLETTIDMVSTFDINSVALTALYVATQMAEELSVIVTGRVCGVEPITVTLDEALDFICEIRTPQAVGLSVTLTEAIELDAVLTQCGYTEAAVALYGGLLGALTLENLTVLGVATVTFNYLELEVAVSAVAPTALIAAASDTVQLDAIISLYNSARVATDTKATLTLAVLLSMLKRTTLEENDSYSLSDLDHQSLQAIAFIEI